MSTNKSRFSVNAPFVNFFIERIIYNEFANNWITDKNEYKKSEIEGYFKDGKAYGEIKLTLVNGGEYKGNYKYGKWIQATFRSSTGKLVERKYENGKAIKKEDLDFGDFMERIRTKRLENV